MIVVLALVGLVMLIAGGEALVRGASRLALSWGISPLVIGLTVVAFGTSSPELAVSLGAAFSGEADLAVGNVVGSNIFNVLFILGLSALIAPLAVAVRLIRVEVPLMIAVSLAMAAMAWDLRISQVEGAMLFAGVLGYTGFAVVQSRRETESAKAEFATEFAGADDRAGSPLGNGALVVVGLVLLALGAQWLVDGAVALARMLGVSELVIGLTIVAAGTSLPEVAASVMAALKGERDIAVGNVVGSNLFNILAVLGLSSLIAPDGVPVPASALRFDIPVMVGVAIACLPVAITGFGIARWEGGLFLSYYAAYILYLLLDAQQHEALEAFRTAMIWFVLPLTALTLGLVLVQHSRTSRTVSGSG